MRNIGLFTMVFLMSLCAQAQDIHFSQFYNAPLTLNPAMTGLMNHDIRVTANYRSQWESVTVPYRTFSVGLDASILKGFLEDDFFGVGLLMFNDKAGDADLRTTQVQGSVAYSKSLNGDANHYISLGGQFGLVQRSINYSKLTFDSQFDGDVLNTNIASGEELDRDQFAFADFSAGLAWYFVPTKMHSYYAGISMSHLNEPNQSFYTDSRENLYRKMTAHIGMEIGFNESFAFLPGAIFLMQGPHQELNIGGSFKFIFNPDEDQFNQMAMYLGSTHRLNDAQVLMMRFDYGTFGVGFSYDMNFSTLNRASYGRGGPELSVTYRTNVFQNRDYSGPVKCPYFM